MNERKRILMAMSGGTNSSVAAVLLKNQGHEVLGIHLRLIDPNTDELSQSLEARCCAPHLNPQSVKQICEKINIPYFQMNVEDVFQECVVDYFVHEFLKNRTPNPCVKCHLDVKFKHLFQKADELGCSWIATGHYAQVVHDPSTGINHLEKAADLQNDQTYLLSGLSQQKLGRILMPLGGLMQSMIWKLAAEYGLAVRPVQEGQNTCFINDPRYKVFIDSRVSPQLRTPGMIRTVEGLVVGDHPGLHHFSIGQKLGLEIRVQDPEPYFVVAFDIKRQSLVVGHDNYLFHKVFRASSVNWVRSLDQFRGLRCKAQIHPQSEGAECLVTCFENDRVHVEFAEAQRAIIPGQMVVFYEGSEVLGGGMIESLESTQTDFLEMIPPETK